ncbi:MAG: GTP-binding protein [Planctomycetes bacterium]|nr:GTP-binding protein [Planctomycetota bacterium]
MPIRAHLIAGFLGAGKTTTLLHLLRELKGRGERCAVLVNEFGALGIDGTVLAGSSALTVKEIPDGCICCTLAGRLVEALAEIAAKVRPERLFVEPTGLARPEEIRRIFALEDMANLYALGPVLTVVDPLTFLKLQGRPMPFYAGQIAEADVIVTNKLDRTAPADLARFRAALAKANPRARVLETSYWKIPADVLEALGTPNQGAAGAASTGKHGGHEPREHARGESLSFSRPAATRFALARLRAFFAELDAGNFGVRPWRAKGIFHAEGGHVLFNLSGSGVDEQAGVKNLGESRCDIVAEKLPADARRRIEEAFSACAVPECTGQKTGSA